MVHGWMTLRPMHPLGTGWLPMQSFSLHAPWTSRWGAPSTSNTPTPHPPAWPLRASLLLRAYLGELGDLLAHLHVHLGIAPGNGGSAGDSRGHGGFGARPTLRLRGRRLRVSGGARACVRARSLALCHCSPAWAPSAWWVCVCVPALSLLLGLVSSGSALAQPSPTPQYPPHPTTLLAASPWRERLALLDTWVAPGKGTWGAQSRPEGSCPAPPPNSPPPTGVQQSGEVPLAMRSRVQSWTETRDLQPSARAFSFWSRVCGTSYEQGAGPEGLKSRSLGRSGVRGSSLGCRWKFSSTSLFFSGSLDVGR